MTNTQKIKAEAYRKDVNTIINYTADHYDISPTQITFHNKRGGGGREPAQVVHNLCRKLLPPDISLQMIGWLTGNGTAFNHCTVKHGIDRINGFIDVGQAKHVPVMERELKEIISNEYRGKVENVTVQINSGTVDFLNKMATKNGVSRSHLIRCAIEKTYNL